MRFTLLWFFSLCGGYISICILQHISTIRNHNERSKVFEKMSPDVRTKLLCFMFINFRRYILELGGGGNTICCTTGQEILPWVLWAQSSLWIQRVSFIFTERKPGGRRIWDSIYGQDGKPTQMSGVKNSFNWQVKEVCSAGLWWFWQMGFCPCHRVPADTQGPPAGEILRRKIVYCETFFLSLKKILQHNRLEGREE